MAKQTVVRLVDDLDGGEAAETVQFGMDGVLFEIDLSDLHAKELREVMAPYVDAGRLAGKQLGREVFPTAAGRKRENQAVREWARGAGLGVSERGRIPQRIVDEYRSRPR